MASEKVMAEAGHPAPDAAAPSALASPRTLAIDVGGSHLKAAVLDAAGAVDGEAARVATPDPATPKAVAKALLWLVRELQPFDRVSIGFPGVVRNGTVFSAPTLGAKGWAGCDFGAVMEAGFGKPVRILNDASVQGLGVIVGTGLECVLTMGTGVGFALFQDGHLAPHLEMSRHPIRKGMTYNEYLGHAALEAKGKKHWSRRMHKVIDILARVVNYDTLYIGGGNARHIEKPLPKNVRLTPNIAGITGGLRLWDARMDEEFARQPPFRPARAAH